jgi:peptidoglycan/xylan/chitin deacetylase (PgdA/CDA1 family)
MKLCLLFHCLCESYDELPAYSQEMFVSIPDMRTMIEGLSDRGYRFGSLDDAGTNTVTITFDDGYYNNVLFADLAQSYGIPYHISVSAYYNLTGELYPWFLNNGQHYSDAHLIDYYKQYDDLRRASGPESKTWLTRPMSFPELETAVASGLADIGCHGYYHQPLSKDFEQYVHQEQDLALSCLNEHLGIKPKYFSLANGMYSKTVVRELENSFERIFTIEGRPYSRGDRMIHRLNLLSPMVAGPLIQQIDRHLKPLRQIRRRVRSFNRMWR